MNTIVVNLKHEPYDVYIGRAGRGKRGEWGNPFDMARGKPGERDRVCDAFEHWVKTSDSYRARWIREHVKELRGKRLGCFCAPLRCHGDTLARMAEE